MKKKSIILLFLISSVLLLFYIIFFNKKSEELTIESSFNSFVPTMPVFSEKKCNILDYGAVSDRNTSNSVAFHDAISDCAKNGGGNIIVPKGIWLTSPIHLMSNINLHLEKGAIIKFDTDLKKYLPEVFSRFEGIEYKNYSPLIYANGVENIAITGEGELDGQEKLWNKDSDKRQASIVEINQMGKNNIPLEERNFGNEEYLLQSSFIQFINCNKILIEGVSIKDSPNWTIHPIYSQDITIRQVEIDNSGQNSDGISIDSSKYVLIENSKIRSGDDAIAIKSGTNEDGRRINISSENIIIRNIEIPDAHSGLAIGSEMSGGVNNVFAENLKMDNVQYGIRMKSTPKRGGVVEDIEIKNIEIDRAAFDTIQIDLKYREEVQIEEKIPPIFRNITIENLTCRRAKNAANLIGLPESPLENIALKNIEIKAKNDIYLENVKNEKFKNVKIEIH